jgi:anti-sigma B factor antagonist
MPLAITSRMSSNVVIVDINGRLSLLDVNLNEHMTELLEEGHRAFVLNLANVPYIDSFGLGQLITIWTSVRNRGGQLILLRPTDHVQTLFRITKLNTIFHCSVSPWAVGVGAILVGRDFEEDRIGFAQKHQYFQRDRLDKHGEIGTKSDNRAS